MKVTGIIPARYHSTRLPAKALADIEGKPMIQWVYEACKSSGLFTDLLIATDHDEILKAATSFGAEVRMTSNSHRNGTERIAELVRNGSFDSDVVINVQGDEPFISKEPIEKLISAFEDPQTQIASLFRIVDDKKMRETPSIVKVVTDQNNRALYFSRSPIPHHRENQEEGRFQKHVGLYAFRPTTLLELVKLPISKLEEAESLEQLRWLDHGYSIQMVECQTESLSIDTEADLNKARQIAKSKI